MVTNYFDDRFNEKNTRNKDNTAHWNYNCGGWALNTFSWYKPTQCASFCNWGTFEFRSDFSAIEVMSVRKMLSITKKSVDCMLKEFKDLRVIKNLKELKTNEYAIAFRIGRYINDFHYCKRAKNGHWTHKMGGGLIRPILKRQVLADNWFEKYYGNLVLFAKKY